MLGKYRYIFVIMLLTQSLLGQQDSTSETRGVESFDCINESNYFNSRKDFFFYSINIKPNVFLDSFLIADSILVLEGCHIVKQRINLVLNRFFEQRLDSLVQQGKFCTLKEDYHLISNYIDNLSESEIWLALNYIQESYSVYLDSCNIKKIPFSQKDTSKQPKTIPLDTFVKTNTNTSLSPIPLVHEASSKNKQKWVFSLLFITILLSLFIFFLRKRKFSVNAVEDILEDQEILLVQKMLWMEKENITLPYKEHDMLNQLHIIEGYINNSNKRGLFRIKAGPFFKQVLSDSTFKEKIKTELPKNYKLNPDFAIRLAVVFSDALFYWQKHALPHNQHISLSLNDQKQFIIKIPCFSHPTQNQNIQEIQHTYYLDVFEECNLEITKNNTEHYFHLQLK